MCPKLSDLQLKLFEPQNYHNFPTFFSYNFAEIDLLTSKITYNEAKGPICSKLQNKLLNCSLKSSEFVKRTAFLFHRSISHNISFDHKKKCNLSGALKHVKWSNCLILTLFEMLFLFFILSFSLFWSVWIVHFFHPWKLRIKSHFFGRKIGRKNQKRKRTRCAIFVSKCQSLLYEYDTTSIQYGYRYTFHISYVHMRYYEGTKQRKKMNPILGYNLHRLLLISSVIFCSCIQYAHCSFFGCLSSAVIISNVYTHIFLLFTACLFIYLFCCNFFFGKCSVGLVVCLLFHRWLHIIRFALHIVHWRRNSSS